MLRHVITNRAKHMLNVAAMPRIPLVQFNLTGVQLLSTLGLNSDARLKTPADATPESCPANDRYNQPTTADPQKAVRPTKAPTSCYNGH